jgi:hypothetical protein
MWIAGELAHQGELTDIVNLIGNSRVSGELFYIGETTVKTLSFKQGDIYAVTSDAPEDRIGEIACRSGLLSVDEVRTAVERCPDEEKLGAYLVSINAINAHELYSLLQEQIEEVFYSLLLVKHGQYYFYREDIPNTLATPYLLPTQNLLLEGMQRIDELSYFREKIPSARMVFVRSKVTGTPFPLNETEIVVLELIDGVRDLEAIARESRFGEFLVTKAAFRMLQGGLIKQRESDRLGDAGRAARSSGCLDVIGVFNKTFRRLFKAACTQNRQSGILQALSSFFEANTTYRELFEGVRLGPDGTFDTSQVCKNLATIPVEDRTGFIYEALNEFLSFELFILGETLEEHDLDALHEQLDRIFDVGGERRPPTAVPGFCSQEDDDFDL